MTYHHPAAGRGATRRTRIAVGITAVLGLSLLVALLLTLKAPPDSGYGGTAEGGGALDGNGENPYAARFDRGSGSGTGDDGAGQGSAGTAQEGVGGSPEAERTDRAAGGGVAGAAGSPSVEASEDTAAAAAAPEPDAAATVDASAAPETPPEVPPGTASAPPPAGPPVADVPAIALVDKPPAVHDAHRISSEPVDRTATARAPQTAGGGPYGQRSGSAGKRGGGRARDRGMTDESEAAVERGLKWLAKVQTADGSWNMGSHPVGETALALLAFLGAGYTHKDGQYRSTVRKGLDYLLSQLPGRGAAARERVKSKPLRALAPRPAPVPGPSSEGRFSESTFYSQGVATMVLCEVYGMTRDASFKEPAQQALKCVFENCGPDGGYGYGGPGDDTHVTSFQVMAHKAGLLAGLTKADAGKWRSKVLGYYSRALSSDGTTGYTSASGDGGSPPPELPRGKRKGAAPAPAPMPAMPPGLRGDPRGTRTAVGLFVRMFLGCDADDKEVQRIAKVLDTVGPQVMNAFQVYDGSYGMFQVGGSHWKEWNRKCRDEVVALQTKEGDAAGSWSTGQGMQGGQVVNTAFYIMSLEVYYRYLSVNRK